MVEELSVVEVGDVVGAEEVEGSDVVGVEGSDVVGAEG